MFFLLHVEDQLLGGTERRKYTIRKKQLINQPSFISLLFCSCCFAEQKESNFGHLYAAQFFLLTAFAGGERANVCTARSIRAHHFSISSEIKKTGDTLCHHPCLLICRLFDA